MRRLLKPPPTVATARDTQAEAPPAMTPPPLPKSAQKDKESGIIQTFNPMTPLEDADEKKKYVWNTRKLPINLTFGPSMASPASNLERINNAWGGPQNLDVLQHVSHAFMQALQPGDILLPVPFLTKQIGPGLGGPKATVGRISLEPGTTVHNAPIPLSIGLWMCHACAKDSTVQFVEGAEFLRMSDGKIGPLYALHVGPGQMSNQFTGFVRPKQSAAEATFLDEHCKGATLKDLTDKVSSEKVGGGRIKVHQSNPVVLFTRKKIIADAVRAFASDPNLLQIPADNRQEVFDEHVKRELEDMLPKERFSEYVAMKLDTYKLMCHHIVENARRTLTLDDAFRFAAFVISPNLPYTSPGDVVWRSEEVTDIADAIGIGVSLDDDPESEPKMTLVSSILIDVFDQIIRSE